MARSLNSWSIIGRLAAAPEVRHTASGTVVCNFRVAVDGPNGADGRAIVEWVNVVAWEKLAEICGEYLVKGSLVMLSGRHQTRSWVDADNVERSRPELVADFMQMLGSPGGAAAAAERRASNGRAMPAGEPAPV